MNLQNIKKKYASLDTERLIELANNLNELNSAEIPILQEELYERGYEDEVSQIELFLNPGQPRISMGQSSGDLNQPEDESILRKKQNLENKGIDVFDLLNEEQKIKSAIETTLKNMRRKGVSEQLIKDKLKEQFNVDDEWYAQINADLNKRAKWQKKIGVLLMLGSIFAFLVFGSNGTFSGTSVLSFFIGIGLLIDGSRRMQAKR